MPYDQEIEDGIIRVIASWKNTEKKKMFGGSCHLINGNMFSGVYKDYLILRLGEEAAKEAMKQKYVREFDITGRPMKGWVMVEKDGFKDSKSLKAWLEKAKEFAAALPAK
jgi:TfoX/Sxy family transcriptional regulator of competence genes